MEQAENSLLINTIILKLQRQQVASIIGKSKENSTETVSYTHLTLPTKLSV